MDSPDPELAPFADVGSTTAHSELTDALRRSGWTTAGIGDWAVVLASPRRRWAARISPFDPAAPYSAELYRLAESTGRVPRVALHRRLAGGADLTVLEHLAPSAPVDAAELHRAIARRDPEVGELVDLIREVHSRALRELPWCGPLDDNPANVMVRRDGGLVVTDLFYADGPELYRVAEEDPDALVPAVPTDERRHLTEIPVASSGPWSDEQRERVRRGIAEADARASA